MIEASPLPSFAQPPLDEVVLGVQYEAPENYTSIWSSEVWKLFRDEFPYVEEMPRLEPQFETFGGSVPASGFQFNFGPAPTRGRFWFVSEERTHLIQFQEDRFLLNWRKRPDGISSSKPYPRFEPIFASFRSSLQKLESFFIEMLGCKIKLNQAEVSYINLIKGVGPSEVSKYTRFIEAGAIPIEGLSAFFTEVIYDQGGNPEGRLTHELQSLIEQSSREPAYRLSLTYRGRPSGTEISDALGLIERGRERIVRRFAEITSEHAHQDWGRIE
jgi:uncharacterized protein (TIGR04255 family)